MARRRVEAVVVGRGVFLEASAAGLVARALQGWVRQAQRAHQEVSPALLMLLAQLEEGASPGTDAHVSASVPKQGGLSPSSHGKVLDTADVAELLAVTEHDVRDLARRGSLPGSKHAGRWLFDVGDVARHLEQVRERAER